MRQLLVFAVLCVGIQAQKCLDNFDTTVAQDTVTFMVVGDWGGKAFPAQGDVADGMNIWAGNNPSDFIISVGDNFYQEGITSPSDSQVQNQWREIYDGANIAQLNWFLTLGNHDYGDSNDDREWNQVYLSSSEPRWYMCPQNYHSMHIQANGFDIDIWFVDTEAMKANKNDWQLMVDWFNLEAMASTADYKLMVSHHFVYSSGDHGPITSVVYNTLLPIMTAAGIDMIFSGHDHNLQHLRDMDELPGPYMEHVISGSGGAGLYLMDRDNRITLEEDYNVYRQYGEAIFGFAGVKVTATEITVEFLDRDANLLYSFVRPHDL